MGAQLRIYRRRIRSVKATKKITKAMELISASRIVKAQQRVAASSPYATELTRAVSALATFSNVEHPLTAAVTDPKRAAVLIIASDRGMAGAYASNAIKEGDQLTSLLKSRGLEVDHYLVGRKALNYYRFRNRAIAASWTGFSDNPTYANAKEIADTVIASFLQENGADELHIIYTEFVSMITQRPLAKRMLPLEVVESSAPLADGPLPLYEFEPSAGDVLDALLPRYVESRIFNALLQSAASEHAARRRAMKSATDNAEELIKSLTRRANAARQAEITQEISEIVGGADALASATSGGE
jgi:F-type H+-transporting ATPase subunit gamma